MSEAIPGVPPAPAVPRPRDAAAVILVRAGESGTELFWVRRGSHLSFSPGFWAFPGGGVDRSDAAVPVRGADGERARLVAAAARELFEETGVLLARGGRALEPDARANLRRAVLEERLSMAALLEQLGAELHAEDFADAGRWVTPEFAPIRFDARFFLVELPAGQAAEVWPGELAAGDWIKPQEALARWRSGAVLLHPPNLVPLQLLAERPPRECLAALRAPPFMRDFIAERIEFEEGVFFYPLETPTLPPARHTNCYLVGNGELLVVDPGSPDRREQERLYAFAAALRAEGRTVKAVFLTHHHVDHVAGAQAASAALGAPIWAHRDTASRVPGVQRTFEDGEVIELAGAPPMRLEVLHTPGHAAGHLCLYDRARAAVICGDMVSGASTIVIDPPEGDMALYLASLERLAALAPAVLFPSHGPVITEAGTKLDAYRRHRAWREERLLAAVLPEGATLQAIVERAYDDTPAPLHGLAARSALAGLIKLEREGRLKREGDRFRAA